MKKIIPLFLVFSLLALSGNLLAKERRGAELIVQKKDGQQVRGELITVKEHSLLLLDSKGKDASIDNCEEITGFAWLTGRRMYRSNNWVNVLSKAYTRKRLA